MFVVDTNVLVYAANQDAPEGEACLELLNAWRTQAVPWYSTWPILYELLRVTTHPRVFPRPLSLAQAWRFVEALLATPNLRILVPTPRHAQVAAAVFGEVPRLAGSVLHDLHTVVLMREHGVRRIYTRDADFRRFSDIEVVDPLAGGSAGQSGLARRRPPAPSKR